jgi:XTP/dITP diphosphohydrolase
VSMLRVALATKNPGKVREIATILERAPIALEGPSSSWEPPPEDDPTYRENALTKARSLVQLMDVPCLADDSGIEVDALDGGPGPRSARYSGDDATEEQNLRALIEVVRRTPTDARGARYRCVAVLVTPAGVEHVAEGSVEGALITDPRGTGGFGYDPIFVPLGEERTMAELGPAEKDAISHRGKAFRALIPALRTLAGARGET